MITKKNSVFVLQSMFLAFLLIVEWTELRNEITLFFSQFDLSDWERILFYIPLILSLQIIVLWDKKFYYFNLVTYIFFFILEFYVLVILLTGAGNGIEVTNFNLAVKFVELSVLVVIIVLTKKIIK